MLFQFDFVHPEADTAVEIPTYVSPEVGRAVEIEFPSGRQEIGRILFVVDAERTSGQPRMQTLAIDTKANCPEEFMSGEVAVKILDHNDVAAAEQALDSRRSQST